VSNSIAAWNAPSTFTAGLVKSFVAAKASSIVPASMSAAMNWSPRVLAARGNGVRPSIASQNDPERSYMTAPCQVEWVGAGRRGLRPYGWPAALY
jgi:hypothetical protein